MLHFKKILARDVSHKIGEFRSVRQRFITQSQLYILDLLILACLAERVCYRTFLLVLSTETPLPKLIVYNFLVWQWTVRCLGLYDPNRAEKKFGYNTHSLVLVGIQSK